MESEALKGRRLGAERSARLARGVSSSLATRVITTTSPLLLIPLTITYLDADSYGVWMAATALTSMFLWADLGLGNTLMTRLSPAYASGNQLEVRALVRAAYKILIPVGVGAFVIVATLGRFIPWESLFNSRADSPVGPIAILCVGTFFLNVPASLVHRILYSTHAVPTSNWLQALGALLSVGGGAITVGVEAPSVVVVGAVLMAPVIVNLVATIVVLKKLGALNASAPSARVAGMFSSGLRFASLGIISAVALNSDFLIVAQLYGASEVAGYSVTARLFLALGMIVTVVNTPLWPANAEALRRGDTSWVKRTTKTMSILSSATVALAGVILLFLGETVLDVIGQGQANASMTLMLGLAAYWIPFAISSPFFMVQNSMALLGPQFLGWIAFLVISLFAKWAVAGHVGIEWIPLVGAATYVATLLPASLWGGSLAIKRSEAASGNAGSDD